MLTVTALTNAEYLLGSVALGIDEYYMGIGEVPGVWMGRWSTGLGVAGVVEADALRALIDGNDPVSGASLLVGLRERKVKAFDLTFSAPKGASLLWALGSEPIADVVMAAHSEAVSTALGFLEERAALARIQIDGLRRHVPTEGWAVAGFVHRTSRAGDPQLHTHCLVPNVVRREDGRCVAIAARPMFVWARAAGSIYQADLQRLLSLRLGVEWQADRNNTREIDGFTPEALRTFSKRTVEIEAELEATGASYEAPALRRRADDQASLASRPAKDHTATPQSLCGRWQAEAAEIGLEIGTGLERQVCWRDSDLRAIEFDEIADRLVDDEHGLCAHSARFAEHDVISHVAGLAVGTLSTVEIADIAERFLRSDLVVRLTPSTTKSGWEPARWSTVAQRDIEDDTLVILDRLSQRAGTPIAEPIIAGRLAAAGFLGADQCQAVCTLCGPGGSVRTVLAPAGYGKTAMAHVSAGCATTDGRPVIAVATTAKAVAELEAAGLSARTIARLRYDLCDGRLPTGAVVILDEISQTSTLDAHSVLAAVDACPGGQLWVLGDPRQAPSVKAGGIAAEIEARADAATIPAAWLTVNRRQADPDDRQALGILRCGDAFASQQLRRDHGWEHTAATPEDTRRAMADAVTTDIVTHGPPNTIALVVSHAQAEDITDRIRRRLTDAGAITGKTITGPGWTSDRHYQTGDRILLHTRHGDRHSPLVNGTVGTITAVDEQGVLFHPDRRRTRATPSDVHSRLSGGRLAERLPCLGTHRRRRPRRHLESRPPPRDSRPRRLPRLHRPIPLRATHPHLEHRQPADHRLRRPSRPRSRPRPSSRRRALSHPRHHHGRRQRPVDRRQPAARTHRHPPRRPRHGNPPTDNASSTTPATNSQPPERDSTPPTPPSATPEVHSTAIGMFAPLTRNGRAQRREFENQLSSRRAAAIDAAGSVATAEAEIARLTQEQAAHDRHEHDHGWRRDAIDNAWEHARPTLDRRRPGLRPRRPNPRVRRRTLAHRPPTPRRPTRHHRSLSSRLISVLIENALAPRCAPRAQPGTTPNNNSPAAKPPSMSNSPAAGRDATRPPSANPPTKYTPPAKSSPTPMETSTQPDNTWPTSTAIRRPGRPNSRPPQHNGTHSVSTSTNSTPPSITPVPTACSDSPTIPTQLHLDVLGPVPTGTAGRAVWCHQANRLEHHLDHAIRDDVLWQRLVDDLSITPTLARIADRHIAIRHHTSSAQPTGHPSPSTQKAIHAASHRTHPTSPAPLPEIDLGL